MQQDQHRLVHLVQPIGRDARAHHHAIHIELSFFETIKPGAGGFGCCVLGTRCHGFIFRAVMRLGNHSLGLHFL